MKAIKLLLATLVPCALATAPLMRRGVEDGIDNSYIVVMKKGADANTLQKHYGSVKASTQRHRGGGKKGFVRKFQVNDFNAYHIECDNATLDNIRNNELVDHVAQNGRVTVQAAIPRSTPEAQPLVPRQASHGDTWGLGRISHRQPHVSQYVDKSPPSTYAYILDTGIRLTHQEFGSRASCGWNFIANNSVCTDDNGHGTHTAGTVGGNTVGVDNSTFLIAVKVLDAGSSGTWDGLIAGVDWAVNDAKKRGAITRSVINMSIGGPQFPTLDTAIQSAVAAGMTVVVAASNYGSDACAYTPARAPDAITVAATDTSDNRPSWSNFGSCVDIFAPGLDIVSSWKDSDTAYLSLSGTSMASPHAAGLATYLMSRDGVATPAGVISRMRELGTKDKVQNANGSPNLIAFNGNPAEL